MAEQSGQENTSPESPRERARRARATRGGRPKTPRGTSPTRSIEPGIVHYKIAQGILETAKKRAEQNGVELDVGEYPDFDGASGNGDDPEQIVRLVAHAVARVGDRFRFLRRFSRNMEGQEKRAGVLSDLLSAIWALYKRNPDSAEELARRIAAEVAQQRATREQAKPKPTGGNSDQR